MALYTFEGRQGESIVEVYASPSLLREPSLHTSMQCMPSAGYCRLCHLIEELSILYRPDLIGLDQSGHSSHRDACHWERSSFSFGQIFPREGA